MALDGGGSSTLAFEGTVLNRPSDGRERSVANSFMLQYFGVYSPEPAEEVVSPNGDGVSETQKLSFKVVRPSDVTVTLTGPGNKIAFQETAPRTPGSYPVAFPPAPLAAEPPVDPTQPVPPPVAPQPLAEGRWTLTVNSTDDQGLGSTTTRRFWVNSTLGFLRAPARIVVRPSGGRALIRWTLSRSAFVRVSVLTTNGVLVRRVASRRFKAVGHVGREAAGRQGRRRRRVRRAGRRGQQVRHRRAREAAQRPPHRRTHEEVAAGVSKLPRCSSPRS
jgi:hypothetical protein